MLAILRHPAIPRYIEYFEVESFADKVFHIVQVIAPGKSLQARSAEAVNTHQIHVFQTSPEMKDRFVPDAFRMRAGACEQRMEAHSGRRGGYFPAAPRGTF